MRRKPAVIVVLAALVLAAAPAALAADPGFGPPSTGSDSGEAIRWLYWFVFAICAVVFVAVETALILFVIRFRRRGSAPPDAEGPQIHGNTRVEIIWTVIPAIILAGIAIVVLARSSAVQATGGDRSDELVIRVEGHQFYWEYVYPDGQISIDTLILPVDRPVKLELVSYDVIHSWWVPDITGKRDAIPGKTNTLNFTPNREGVFEGKCAELCGVLHAVMPTVVEVVTETEFTDRLTLLTGQDQPGATQLALGRESWERVCAKCHGLAAQGGVGPNISQSPLLRDKNGISKIIRQGTGKMPAVGNDWSQEQLDATIAYLQQRFVKGASGGGQG